MASQLVAPARLVDLRRQEVLKPTKFSRLPSRRRYTELNCQDTDFEVHPASRCFEAVPSQANQVEHPDDPQRGLSLPPHALRNISARLQTCLVILAVVSGWHACHAPPSLALVSGWRPRRHHRRLGEKDRVVHQQTVSNGTTSLHFLVCSWTSHLIALALLPIALAHFLV